MGAEYDEKANEQPARADHRSSSHATANTVPSGPSRRQGTFVVGPNGDRFEQRADRVADAVMRSIDNRSGKIRPATRGTIQRDALAEVDAAANDKRLAHAEEDYLFDQSLTAGDDLQDTNARLAGQKQTVKSENDVLMVAQFLYKKNPALAVQQFGLSKNQEATLKARMKDTENIPQTNRLASARKDRGASRQVRERSACLHRSGGQQEDRERDH